jgi:membrane protein YdbS with pleckstrin-like domain
MAPLQLSHVDSGIIGVWRWEAAIATLIITVAVTAFSFSIPPLWPLAPLLVFIAGILRTWWWPPLSYRHLRFGVDDTGIAIESGVLWRSRIALPRVRIQHTDVSQGPLERRYDIGTLKLYTAGSRHTRIELPGLRHEDAIALRDALLAEGAGSGV